MYGILGLRLGDPFTLTLKHHLAFELREDYALDPLPGQAIWACLDGRVQQGKLYVEALLAVLGRVDKRLAVFVEDEFAAQWIVATLREGARRALDEVGVYQVGGDGNAVATHTAHRKNPSIPFQSLCYLDGNSKQKEDHLQGVFRLPGAMPERTIIKGVMSNAAKTIPALTAACQTSASRQTEVQDAIKSVMRTNRDAHLLFTQIGRELGDVPKMRRQRSVSIRLGSRISRAGPRDSQTDTGSSPPIRAHGPTLGARLAVALSAFRFDHAQRRVGAGLREDARSQLGLSRRGCVALPISCVARANARARAGEGADRYPPARHDHGSIHGAGRCYPSRPSREIRSSSCNWII